MATNKLSFYAEKQRQDAINQNVHLNDDFIDFRYGEQNDEYDIEEHEQFV